MTGRGGGDIPGYPEAETRLHDREVDVCTQNGGGGGDHDDEPEVQLGFGPEVFSFALEDADDGFVGHGFWSGCSGRGVRGWLRVVLLAGQD